MTRAVVALATAALCALLLAGPAGAATRRHVTAYRISSAQLSEVVTFQGDGGPACAQAGVCGYSGRIAYGFGSARGVMQTVTRGNRAAGIALLFFGGLTSVNVQGPSGPPCTEKVLHGFEQINIGGTPARMQMLFHQPLDSPDFLQTYCTGPRDADIAHAHALPALPMPARVLDHQKFTLSVSSQKPFHAGPFTGTVTFDAKFRVRRIKHVADILNFLITG